MSVPALRRLRLAGLVIAGAVAVLLLAALLLLSFGWGLLRPMAERRLSASLGRPVRIAAVKRVGGGLFDPLLAIRGVAIAEPDWAGPGAMLQLREARVRLPALPLLAGRVDPQLTQVDGLRLRLIRDAAGRSNWQRPGPETHKGAASPDFGRVLVRDAVIAVDDRQHQHRFTLALASDAQGFRLAGPGSIAGDPARFALAGPPVSGDGPWPFRVEVSSRPVMLVAAGRMRTPLHIGHFTARVDTHGHDLTDLDHLIQAGLPASQPFRLVATVTHDQPTWEVHRLSGTLGRSDLRGDLSIRKEAEGDRTFLKGSLVSNGFDFDDLSSDAQLAAGRAEERRLGPRLFPATKIDLSKLRKTDGELHVDIHRLLAKQPTVFRTLAGTLTLDHGVLTAAPLSAGLVAGTLAGSLVVRHPSGAPLLLVDLRLANSRFEKLFNTRGVLSGPLAGRMKLAGHGGTVRAAIGRSDGRIALAGQNGTMTRRVAAFLGADIGRGIFAGNSDRTGVRCVVASFAVQRGIARPDPLLVDTDIARADGRGQIDLADERIALQLWGTPKKHSLLRLDAPIEASGTIERPKLNPPPQTKTVGGILKMVGKTLGGGGDRPLAEDAACGPLVRKALH